MNEGTEELKIIMKGVADQARQMMKKQKKSYLPEDEKLVKSDGKGGYIWTTYAEKYIPKDIREKAEKAVTKLFVV